jgi:hypothetical protein
VLPKHDGQNAKMTAEIAIMNKSAVAMAADSASTITHAGGQKTYNTVNKLFALSTHLPVGIMIYGSAELMGVPWETIIRVYQKRLGRRRFGRLGQYGNHFVSFLDRKNALFPQSLQDWNFEESVKGYFQGVLKEQIDEKVRKEIDRHGNITNARTSEIAREVIDDHFKDWKPYKPLKHFPKNHRQRLLRRYRRTIQAQIKNIFENLVLSRTTRNQLISMAIDCFSKRRFRQTCSGFVIAGFGETEIFPSVVAYEAESVINNRLKYALFKQKSHTIKNVQNDAVVIPFAQDDVVKTFVEGADPEYQSLVESQISNILEVYPEHIVNDMKFLQKKQREKLALSLRKFGRQLETKIGNEQTRYRYTTHIMPLLEVVEVLPKDELGRMAESLVELTCLKRKMSLNIETVGGPIDVAVISKGEGFIWIKRKHYFDKEFNPQFFTRYNS